MDSLLWIGSGCCIIILLTKLMIISEYTLDIGSNQDRQGGDFYQQRCFGGISKNLFVISDTAPPPFPIIGKTYEMIRYVALLVIHFLGMMSLLIIIRQGIHSNRFCYCLQLSCK